MAAQNNYSKEIIEISRIERAMSYPVRVYIMKKRISLIGIFLLGLLTLNVAGNNAVAQEKDASGPKFEFKAEDNRLELDTVYVSEVEEVNLEIEFKNSGDKPLILSNVRACCGTRVESYPEEPVNPGEEGTIEASFRVVPRTYSINRSVTVASNDPGGQKVLRISGKIKEDQ